MGSNLFVWACIGLAVIGLVGEMYKSKWVIWLRRLGVGSLMIIVMNCLVPQYMISFNWYTVGFSTLLGIPGVMTLYVMRMLL